MNKASLMPGKRDRLLFGKNLLEVDGPNHEAATIYTLHATLCTFLACRKVKASLSGVTWIKFQEIMHFYEEMLKLNISRTGGMHFSLFFFLAKVNSSEW